MYHWIGTKTSKEALMSRSKPRYKVLIRIGNRDISKHTDSKEEARKILKKMKEAAATLSLLDIFRGEICEVN